jgi:L-asparagine transporter-like permease
MVAAILLAILAPGRAFLLLYGLAVAGMFFVWTIILVTHLSFRRTVGQLRLAQLPVRLLLAPFSEVAGLIAIACIAVSTFFVEGLEYSIPSFLVFLLAITAFYRTLSRRDLKIT